MPDPSYQANVGEPPHGNDSVDWNETAKASGWSFHEPTDEELRASVTGTPDWEKLVAREWDDIMARRMKVGKPYKHWSDVSEGMREHLIMRYKEQGEHGASPWLGKQAVSLCDPDRSTEATVAALVDGFRPTDVGNSLRLVAVVDGRIRWVRQWGLWIVYQDGTWLQDVKNVLAVGQAKRVPHKMFQDAVRFDGDARDALLAYAKRSEDAARLTAMVNLARDVPGVLVEHTELDQRHELLNVRNGTIDLRTKELLPHDPEHLITHQLPIMYNPARGYGGLWPRCLTEWQPDEAMRRYLQEKAGSYASGYAPEELDIHHGNGGNGKGKFFGQLGHVLGPYAIVPHKSLLIAQKNEQHETVMAELFGVRLAVAAETRTAARLDEAKIKELTGGDKLRGRRMREDAWYFEPTHCLVLHTNYKPIIVGNDEGIWRRPRLIPWEMTIPEDRRDPELAEKLKGEAECTLNWIVDGAHRWLNNNRRFTVPGKVVEATARYRETSDAYHRFFGLAVIEGTEQFVTAENLYDALTGWRNSLPEEERPPCVTKDALAKHVVIKHPRGKRRLDGREVRGYLGIGLKLEWSRWLDDMRKCCPEALKPTLGDLIPPPSGER